MASARSTVSIARTTPAQKPRGEHNITFNCGFWEGREDVMCGAIRLRVKDCLEWQPGIWFFARVDVKTVRGQKHESCLQGDETVPLPTLFSTFPRVAPGCLNLCAFLGGISFCSDGGAPDRTPFRPRVKRRRMRIA